MSNEERKPPMPSGGDQYGGGGDNRGQYDQHDYFKAQQVVEQARAFVAGYPQTFRTAFIEPALHEAESQRSFSIQASLECVRHMDFVDRRGKALHISNSCGAVFARWLIQRYPQVQPYLRVRASIFDDPELLGMAPW